LHRFKRLTLAKLAHNLANLWEETIMSTRTAQHLITVDHLKVIATLPPGSRIIMPDISWDEYEHLMTQLADNAQFRLSYDQGRLEIMTLSPRHENIKTLFSHLLLVLIEAMDLKIISLGSTTFTIPEAVRGTEPDDCFYIRRAELIEGKETINLATDPGPDLVVEVDITHPSLDKFPIYAELNVIEVWRHNGEQVTFFQLAGNEYRVSQTSDLFPFLSSVILTEFLQQGKFRDILQMVKAFRVWVQTNKPQ
jgi:Uma2 family endonuclease